MPAVCVVGAAVLGVGLVALDQAIGSTHVRFLFPGPASGARSYLSSIISAMISFTGLVFSITIVVLQLSSGQFSPRVLRTFLRDRTIQFALGVFMATFVYAMVVLRAVGGEPGQPNEVPRIAVTVAFGFVLLSVALFIRYIDHVANLVRVATIIHVIGTETRSVLEARFPTEEARAGPPASAEGRLPPVGQWLLAGGPGVVVSADEDALVQLGEDHDLVISLVPRIGDFLPGGGRLASVHEGASRLNDVTPTRAGDGATLSAIARLIYLDIERTSEQDVAFGFRQLVDIAERALSPGINDPTTAAQAIDELHDLLRRLASRTLPSGGHHDQDGALRLVIPQYAFSDYLDLVVGEIFHYGAASAQIPQRLDRMLHDLAEVALPEHQDAIRRWELHLAEQEAANQSEKRP